ncbi:MAG: EMC3/TMCO1 family protein [Candidatus Parvarchaeota archaeon]|jgi:hypothetical protein|nr:EMC3/TMCO1 family protein [Candidatus Parvarchaeota archaeon]MCL5101704.1 EMC3/TMCO1 family protein [Candidatus Parvarchaeota archaeon]
MEITSLFVILIAIGVGASGQLAYLLIVDHEIVRNSKSRMKELQAELKQLKPDDPKFKEVYSQLMHENSKVMKQSMKPTFVTFVPFIIVFLLMSTFFSYTPIAVGSQVQSVLSGQVNGTITFQNNCVTINDSANLTLLSSKLPTQLPATINSGTCTVFLSQNGKTYNASLVGLIGSNQEKTYSMGNASISFSPNPLVIATLPFSIPLIGNQLNWFWTYLIFSLITSLTLNRILIRYKLIA